MSAIIAGLTGPVFGTVDQTNVYLDNISEELQSEKTELQNGQGDKVNAAWFAQSTAFRMSYQLFNPSGHAAAALIGHTFAITSDTNFANTYYVDSVTKSRQKGDWMSGELVATVYPVSGFTTTTTTTTT